MLCQNSSLISGWLCEVTIWKFSQKFQIWMTRICNLEKEWNNIIGTLNIFATLQFSQKLLPCDL